MTDSGVGVVDSHAHIISSDATRYPRAPVSGVLPDWLQERSVDAELLLERMPRAGVDKAVLVQYSTAHGYDNQYILDMARQYPRRFVAVCTVDGLEADAPARLSACVELGAGGLRVRAPGRSGPLDWLTCEPLWQRASDLDVPVCVHFMESVQADGLRLLPSMLQQFPSVTVVLDHAGNPPWRDGPPDYGLRPVLDLARFQQLFIKFATINLERLEMAAVEPHRALERLIDGYGARRIMWGSDAPNTPGDYAAMLRSMRAALSETSAADQAWILGGTAVSVYPRLAHAGPGANHI